MDPPDDLLSIETAFDDDDIAHLRVKGEIDTYTAGRLESACRSALEKTAHLRVEVAGVTFIDSSGLNVLVTILNACEGQGGSLVLVEPGPDLRRIFEISGLAATFTFEP